MTVPSEPIRLMSNVYRKILPSVHQQLDYWLKRAEEIPDDELRKQALASINSKMFHCEGGAVFALLAGEDFESAVKFIVAYQTISDYLDNLCDRSTSLDPKDFAALHEAMSHALTVGAEHNEYYRYRNEWNDNGYLQELVETCQNVLLNHPRYFMIKEHLLDLCEYYCDLQIHKHVKVEERVPRLQKWFEKHKEQLPEMEWYEFSACSGSTLGIFCLVSYSFSPEFKEEYGKIIKEGYFPYIQGLHILLDYFIDQEEDAREGDLNFCFYYKNEEDLFNRLRHFVIQADKMTKNLPNKRFHQLINRGLLGLYLSDEKVHKQDSVRELAKNIIKKSGLTSLFFYLNCRVYRVISKWYQNRRLKESL